eukprot:CAMPEP_0198647334 /NCGR_PEP_ID=MMETSP1467-20131203/2639_1 /TAXON_ID=1462469 /ORGANISM="unid. sp., Strain CCMP2135" /LENGTH=64 /DNA_ID=CAMNT_0044382957 /DNA_START=246 /DNA_END=440 /DNA_ORIENTATION=-
MDVRGVERGASSAATGSCRGRARGIAVAQRRCGRARVCGRRRARCRAGVAPGNRALVAQSASHP